jgi:hypothetical protein
MRMKTVLAALACTAALLPTSLPAATVQSPIDGTVTALTYYTSGAFHGAVDIRGGTCGQTPINPGISGSLSWVVTLKSTATTCGSSLSAQNEAAHSFASGVTYRVRSFLKSSGSYSRTCDRCNIGTAFLFSGDSLVDPLHLQVDKYGTKNTAWYAGYTTRGEFISAGEVVGVINN